MAGEGDTSATPAVGLTVLIKRKSIVSQSDNTVSGLLLHPVLVRSDPHHLPSSLKALQASLSQYVAEVLPRLRITLYGGVGRGAATLEVSQKIESKLIEATNGMREVTGVLDDFAKEQTAPKISSVFVCGGKSTATAREKLNVNWKKAVWDESSAHAAFKADKALQELLVILDNNNMMEHTIGTPLAPHRPFHGKRYPPSLSLRTLNLCRASELAYLNQEYVLALLRSARMQGEGKIGTLLRKVSAGEESKMKTKALLSAALGNEEVDEMHHIMTGDESNGPFGNPSGGYYEEFGSKREPIEAEAKSHLAIAPHLSVHTTQAWLVESRAAQMYVMWLGDDLLFSFRGTEGIADVAYDLAAWPVKCKGLPKERAFRKVRVHEGFFLQFSGLLPRIEMECEKLLASVQDSENARLPNILFTGHSLGGACATIAAFFVKAWLSTRVTVECVTFGAPRVGNIAFVTWFDKHIDVSCRIINNLDPVPTVPPSSFGYYHVFGGVVLHDQGMEVLTHSRSLARRRKQVQNQISRSILTLSPVKAKRRASTLFGDHVVLSYIAAMEVFVGHAEEWKKAHSMKRKENWAKVRSVSHTVGKYRSAQAATTKS